MRRLSIFVLFFASICLSLPLRAAGEKKMTVVRFQLLREGKTILVRDQRSGKILRKLTWNGEKFVEER